MIVLFFLALFHGVVAEHYNLTVDIKNTVCPSGIKLVDTPVLLYKTKDLIEFELLAHSMTSRDNGSVVLTSVDTNISIPHEWAILYFVIDCRRVEFVADCFTVNGSMQITCSKFGDMVLVRAENFCNTIDADFLFETYHHFQLSPDKARNEIKVSLHFENIYCPSGIKLVDTPAFMYKVDDAMAFTMLNSAITSSDNGAVTMSAIADINPGGLFEAILFYFVIDCRRADFATECFNVSGVQEMKCSDYQSRVIVRRHKFCATGWPRTATVSDIQKADQEKIKMWRQDLHLETHEFYESKRSDWEKVIPKREIPSAPRFGKRK